MNDQELAIRPVLAERINAIRRKDAAAANAVLAPNLIAFELIPPLSIAGAPARDDAALQAWLDSWEGAIDTEVDELVVHVSGDVGFCHSLNRLHGRRGGREVDFWHRSTLGLLKIEGEWKIAHGHSSVPFHADGSFRAAMDLRP
jgi:ketosteroid isomerase-like protein